MKNILTLFLTLLFLNVLAQDKIDCDKLLSKEIDIEANDGENFKNDFSNLKNCGIDALDIAFFSDSSILGTILITLSTESEKITFGDLLNKILDFKKGDDYLKIREASLISKELTTKIARIENWNEDKIKLEKLDVPESDLLKIHNYIKENSNSKTYKEIFNTLYENQNKKREDHLESSEEHSDIFKNQSNTNLDDLLKKAKDANKPLIIYFTGYGCVNSRKIETKILTQNVVYEKLKDKSYFVSLYVDDKTTLKKSDQFTSASTGKLIKTVGQKYSNLQIEKFQTASQPYFVILDPKGKVIATQAYLTDENEFITFLNKGLKVD